jgi:hypothetical protein
MKTPLLVTGCLIALGAATAHAGDYQLKNRSDFSIPEEAHNPFWPIGWVKPAPTASGTRAPQVSLKQDNFFVSSISIMDGARCAVINGKVYGEGESIPVRINNAKVPVRIVAIRDGGIVVSYEGQGIEVPLKRKEEEALNRIPAKSATEDEIEN